MYIYIYTLENFPPQESLIIYSCLPLLAWPTTLLFLQTFFLIL